MAYQAMKANIERACDGMKIEPGKLGPAIEEVGRGLFAGKDR